MAPKDGADEHSPALNLTTGFRHYPPNRDEYTKSSDAWLKGKIEADNAWPYWRIHDKLYDLTGFADKHPGGKFWIESTRGSDITESFESSHFAPRPSALLKKFYVKDAKTPRNSPFTFKEDGFYMTLKKKVTPILLREGTGPTWKSHFIQDGLLILYLFFMLSAGWHHSYFYAALAGIFMAMCANVAHNFFHQRDNLRMYNFDHMLMSSREWRISHAMSHHNYPNTIYDYEISMFEPHFYFLTRPDMKSHPLYKYKLFMKSLLFLVSSSFYDAIRRLIMTFIKRETEFDLTYLIPPLQILSIMAFAHSVWIGMWLWVTLHIAATVFFVTVGLSAAHHHPTIFHEGDKLPKDRDWGVLQMSATRDRGYVMTSVFLSSISFGNHVLHHLFPTVDISKLPLLLEPLMQTCDEFGIEFQTTNQWELLKGTYRRLLMKHPNNKIPSFLRKYNKQKMQ